MPPARCYGSTRTARCAMMSDHLKMANGLVVTADGEHARRRREHREGPGRVRPRVGREADEPRVWAELPEYPDGICIDREDGIWIASPVGDRFVRVREGGEVTDVVEVPERHADRVRPRRRRRPDALRLHVVDARGARALPRTERGAAIEIVTVAVPAR